jgi:hypothetical protein
MFFVITGVLFLAKIFMMKYHLRVVVTPQRVQGLSREQEHILPL